MWKSKQCLLSHTLFKCIQLCSSKWTWNGSYSETTEPGGRTESQTVFCARISVWMVKCVKVDQWWKLWAQNSCEFYFGTSYSEMWSPSGQWTLHHPIVSSLWPFLLLDLCLQISVCLKQRRWVGSHAHPDLLLINCLGKTQRWKVSWWIWGSLKVFDHLCRSLSISEAFWGSWWSNMARVSKEKRRALLNL